MNIPQDLIDTVGLWAFKLLLLIFLIIGINCLYSSGKILYLGHLSNEWPSTNGVITESQIKTSRGSGSSGNWTQYGAFIQYNYVVDEKTLTSNRITLSDYTSSKQTHAESLLTKYPIGKQVRVFYNPQKPQTAVLEKGNGKGIYITLAVGIPFFLIGTFGLWAIFFKKS